VCLQLWSGAATAEGACASTSDCIPTPLRTHTLPQRTACLKDLQRFLRRDDPNERPAFEKLGELQIMENDVIPLIVTHPADAGLVYQARERAVCPGGVCVGMECRAACDAPACCTTRAAST
jgi:hypothetical protein